jgi:hypothetical protein
VILMPNPALSFTNLVLSHAQGSVHVVITDMYGKTVWEQKNVTGTVIKIPLESFSNGTYIINVKDDRSSTVVKLVKAK